MSVKQEYEVHLDLFEGPLDLLLYLVNRAEVSIVDIKVSLIAAQYLEYIDLMRELNIDVASEYLHMAATLVRIKARELLPDSPPEEGSELEEGIYNRDQLIAQLLEYKKFKEAAGTLKVFESEQFGAFSRGRGEEIESGSEDQEVTLGTVGVFDLLTAFRRILSRVPTQEYRHVVAVDNCRLDDRIEYVLALVSEAKGEVRFEDLFVDDYRKMVLVVTFMAMLELVKMKRIGLRQEEAFGSIFVFSRDDEPEEEVTGGQQLNGEPQGEESNGQQEEEQ